MLVFETTTTTTGGGTNAEGAANRDRLPRCVLVAGNGDEELGNTVARLWMGGGGWKGGEEDQALFCSSLAQGTHSASALVFGRGRVLRVLRDAGSLVPWTRARLQVVRGRTV